MRIQLQLVLCSDDSREETVTDLVTLKKDSQRIEHLSLTLKEAKQLLTATQQRIGSTNAIFAHAPRPPAAAAARSAA